MTSTNKMTAFEQAKEYAMEQADKLNKFTLNEFFTYIHSNYYPKQDISFMNYFLELCDKEGQFVVEHTKLFEYGVMTSTESSKVKEKLKLLGLENEEDYRLADIREPVKQGGFSIKKRYTLTPEAFKKCLMRARKYKDQPIDPVIYCDYYLLLEKVFKLFTDYERAYLTKLLSMKDDKIDKLIEESKLQNKKMEEQNEKIDDMRKDNANQIDEQNKKIDKLLNYSNAITKQNVDLIEKSRSLTDYC